MKNHFKFAHRPLRSGSHVLEAASILKPAGRSKGWEMSRTLPAHLIAERKEKEARAEIADAVAEFRAGRATASGIACRKVAGNKVQIIGHGTESGPMIVENFAAACDYAKSIGRSFVRMGAIHKKL